MKLIILFGDAAVGKMTVGQHLMAQTGLRLFHNHMTIEPVLEVFGAYNSGAVNSLRRVIFEEFLKTDLPGMIFTYLWSFDCQEDWDYITDLAALFESRGAEVYYVELIAPQEVRLQRNRTENRLLHKPSKRDVTVSETRLLADDANYRCVSLPGELPFANYLRLDNTHLPPEEAASVIKTYFDL